ncbi:hypothetical protein ACIP98_26115 [Streptomyces sp. NPDC088354]|uniref:hypothetical protein n=1 Tax=unclassified Streptomyces TaxID=2593676 RepID=UPI0029B4F36F|nr:hypothetical protein [Streptomyces sp. MI02-7b]MDX3073934.1 hypothetical protein [Streptomyces sp. MI02-7b]
MGDLVIAAAECRTSYGCAIRDDQRFPWARAGVRTGGAQSAGVGDDEVPGGFSPVVRTDGTRREQER